MVPGTTINGAHKPNRFWSTWKNDTMHTGLSNPARGFIAASTFQGSGAKGKSFSGLFLQSLLLWAPLLVDPWVMLLLANKSWGGCFQLQDTLAHNCPLALLTSATPTTTPTLQRCDEVCISWVCFVRQRLCSARGFFLLSFLNQSTESTWEDESSRSLRSTWRWAQEEAMGCLVVRLLLMFLPPVPCLKPSSCPFENAWWFCSWNVKTCTFYSFCLWEMWLETWGIDNNNKN